MKKALAVYDENMAKLRAAMDSETAQKIFNMLTLAKEQIIKAIELVTNSPVGQAAIAKLNDIQAQAQSKIAELKAKVPGAGGAAAAPAAEKAE